MLTILLFTDCSKMAWIRINTRNHTKEKPYLIDSYFFFFFKIDKAKKVNRVSKIHAWMYVSEVCAEGIFVTFRGGFKRGAHPARAPSIFCRDRAPDFVWAPRAKRMHQIVWIDFENYNFSLLLRGHIPPQTPPVSTGAEVLSVLNFSALSFKKSWISPWLSPGN